MYRLLLSVALIASGGCRSHPLQICTDSQIDMAGPLDARVAVDLPARPDRGPVLPWTVAGRESRAGGPRVALIDVDGLLVNANSPGPYSAGENPVALFRERLDAAGRDPRVRAVVVRINTPGGAVTASDVMRHELDTFRARTGLPVVAYLMGVSTGGGYYLATAADAIYAHPTTVTGGIGVMINLYNLEDAMAQFNVFPRTITSGEHIAMGSAVAPISPEAERMLQSMADEFHRRFRWIVVRSRPAAEADPTTFDGRVFTATEAQRRGLVDELGYLDDAVAAAARAAGAGDVQVVMLHRRSDPARTPYAVTPNASALADLLPINVPGFDRSRLPTFLYAWGIEPTLDVASGGPAGRQGHSAAPVAVGAVPQQPARGSIR